MTTRVILVEVLAQFQADGMPVFHGGATVEFDGDDWRSALAAHLRDVADSVAEPRRR